jgi:hypothetical protein
MRVLRDNGYIVTKSDVLWILDHMTEVLERKVDEFNSIPERKVLCEVITTTREIKVTFLFGYKLPILSRNLR